MKFAATATSTEVVLLVQHLVIDHPRDDKVGHKCPVQDAVMIGCPLTVSEAELDQLVSVLAASIDEVTRAL